MLQPDSEAYHPPLAMAVITTTTTATPQHPTPSPLARSAPLFDPYEDAVCVARPVAVAKGTPLDAVEAGLKVPLGATSDISVGRGVSKRRGKAREEEPTREIIPRLDSRYSRHQLRRRIFRDGRKESHARGVA